MSVIEDLDRRIAMLQVERDGDYPSPTVKVNGLDVMGDPATSARACRLDVPTEERVIGALRRAAGGDRR